MNPKRYLALGCLCCLAGLNLLAESLQLQAVNPLVKVFQQMPLAEGEGEAVVKIEALRNEYEPAQICITSVDYAGPVRFAISPLRRADGEETIDSIGGRFVGYVKTPEKTADNNKFPFEDSPATYPDPLLLDEEVSLQPGQNQALWLTVQVPREAEPGEYAGQVEVLYDGGTASLPVQLTVYSPVLPDEGPFRLGSWGGDSMMAARFEAAPYENWLHGIYTQSYLDFIREMTISNRKAHRARFYSDQPLWDAKYVKVYWQNGRYAFDYQVLDTLLSAIEAGYAPQSFAVYSLGVVTVSVAGNGGELGENEGLRTDVTVLNPDGSVNEDKSFKGISTHDPQYLEYIAAYFQAMEQHLRQNGWLDKVYFKALDEPAAGQLSDVIELNTFLKEKAPGIRWDATFWQPKLGPKLAEVQCFDMPTACTWAVRQSEELYEIIRRETARGRTFAFYNDPLVVINEPWLLTRKIGWFCEAMGATGYMHWAYAWKGNPWEEPFDASFGFGAHYLVYQDKARQKILDSIRWEFLRETAEDFDTMAMLKALGGDTRKYAEIVGEMKGGEYQQFTELRHQLLTELENLQEGK